MHKRPYCLCYQYDVDSFGFATQQAEQLLNDLCPNLFYWDDQKK